MTSDTMASSVRDTVTKTQPHSRQTILDLIRNEQWEKVKRRVSKAPEEAGRLKVVNLDGQKTQAYAIHYLLRKKEVPVDVIESVVKAWKDALSMPDSVLNELPIHIACQHDAPIATLDVLVHAYPEGLLIPDRDGNLPIHYACSLEDPEAARYLMNACPASARKTNCKGQTPLHLACARYDISIDLVQELIQLNENACKTPDWQGRLPVHSACMWKANTRVIETLLKAHPEAVRAFDLHNLTPYGICRKVVHLPTSDPTVTLLRAYRKKHGDFFVRGRDLVQYQAENVSAKLSQHHKKPFRGVNAQ